MEKHTSVPVCPPAVRSVIECFLLSRGWTWSDDCLTDTLRWLELQEIKVVRDFVGLGNISDLPNAHQLPSDICEYLQKLIKVLS